MINRSSNLSSNFINENKNSNNRNSLHSARLIDLSNNFPSKNPFSKLKDNQTSIRSNFNRTNTIYHGKKEPSTQVFHKSSGNYNRKSTIINFSRIGDRNSLSSVRKTLAPQKGSLLSAYLSNRNSNNNNININNEDKIEDKSNKNEDDYNDLVARDNILYDDQENKYNNYLNSELIPKNSYDYNNMGISKNVFSPIKSEDDDKFEDGRDYIKALNIKSKTQNSNLGTNPSEHLGTIFSLKNKENVVNTENNIQNNMNIKQIIIDYLKNKILKSPINHNTNRNKNGYFFDSTEQNSIKVTADLISSNSNIVEVNYSSASYKKSNNQIVNKLYQIQLIDINEKNVNVVKQSTDGVFCAFGGSTGVVKIIKINGLEYFLNKIHDDYYTKENSSKQFETQRTKSEFNMENFYETINQEVVNVFENRLHAEFSVHDNEIVDLSWSIYVSLNLIFIKESILFIICWM
jgi:hypothetical protein